jgi:hypothetical protein
MDVDNFPVPQPPILLPEKRSLVRSACDVSEADIISRILILHP